MRSKLPLLAGLMFALSSLGYAQSAPSEEKKADATQPPPASAKQTEGKKTVKQRMTDRANASKAKTKRDMSTNAEVSNQMSMAHTAPPVDKTVKKANPTKARKDMTPEERKDLQDRAQKASTP